MAHRLSCAMAGGIFLDQGSNLCLLHWQVDSLPPIHREALEVFITASALANYIYICVCVCVCVHSKGRDIFQNCIPMVILGKD